MRRQEGMRNWESNEEGGNEEKGRKREAKEVSEGNEGE